MTTGWYDGVNVFGMWTYNDAFPTSCKPSLYGTNYGSYGTGSVKQQRSFGLTPDATKSGIVGTVTRSVLDINFAIRY